MSDLPGGPRSKLLLLPKLIRDPLGSSLRFREIYGDPMTQPGLGDERLLVTGQAEAIRQIFSAPPDTFASAAVEQMTPLFGAESIFVLSGARHAAVRKLLLPPFHGQRIRVYGDQIRALTLAALRPWQRGSTVIAQPFMDDLSLQVIVHLVFGVTDETRAAVLATLLRRYRAAFTGALLPLLVPWLRRDLWGVGPWARLRRVLRETRQFLDEEVAQRRSAKVERSDILSLLLLARHEDTSPLSGDQLFSHLLTLLFAGHTTTANALCWALYFLAQNEAPRERLTAELTALGSSPSVEALAEAPYLEAVCNETLRLRPAIPTAARLLVRPLKVAGYDLPAGMSVGANVVWAHMDATTFPEPDRFRPERFLERGYTPYEFLPFGGGHRRCIGAAFALYEMKLVLGTILSMYRCDLASATEIRAVLRDTLAPGAPIQLVTTPIA